MARLIETNTTPWPTVDVDPVTLDVIENALQNARVQMDAILFRTAISPIIREQRDGFPVLTNREGMMLAGQFGSPVDGFVDNYDGEVSEGDVLLTNDPYACQGAISHLNDWLFCMPVFYEGRLLGWTAMFGHMSDISGMTAASMPVNSSDLLQEGIVIPPVKIVSKGELQKDLLRMAMRNTRTPDWNEADFFAILSACRTGAARLVEMADRFGADVLVSAQDQLLKRNREAMRSLIVSTMPEKKVVFEDWICDDARGHGPYKLGCEMWREGDKLIFDFSRTDPQSAGCVNFYLNERMFKMFCGQFMVNVYDPQIVLNDGYIDLIDVRIPKGTLLNPIAPAALNGRTHAGASSTSSAGFLVRRTRISLSPPDFPTARTSCIRASTRATTGSCCSRSASAASPESQAATGRTATRCGRNSATCRTNISRRISRSGSIASNPCRTPAARASIAVATACAPNMCSTWKAKSPSTTIAG
jgi:N-methylhydantoinase B